MRDDLSDRTRLKLALYQPWIYLHGGLERSILELVRHSRHQWTIYTGYYDGAGTFPDFARVDVRCLRPTSVNRSLGSVLKSALNVAMQKLPLDPDVDAVVIWCDGIGDMLTFRNQSRPLFNICSTPLRAVFDPTYSQIALGQRGPLGRVGFAAFRVAFRFVDRWAWRRYAGVVSTSQEVESRIIKGGLFGKARMVLAHPGIDWSPELPDVSYEPLILVSGRIMWTKNIELAIEGFKAAALPPPWKLVIAGYVDQKSAVYLAKLKSLAEGHDNIIFVTSPSDKELGDLLRRASFTLFTPLNEDWGIAPLEAMAQAKPVIAVKAGGPLESIPDGQCGYLLEPDPLVWSERIAALASDRDLIRTLGTQAHQHVSRFTWDNFAKIIDEALVDWIAAPRPKPATSRLRARGLQILAASRMVLGGQWRKQGGTMPPGETF